MTEIKHEYGIWIVYINGNPKFSFIYREEAEAVAEVIDALVEQHQWLTSIPKGHHSIDKIQQWIMKMPNTKKSEQALKKAGCEECS